MNPRGIVRYEAYFNSLKGSHCTVEASEKDLECTLRGIQEAVEFFVVIRACSAGYKNCEDPIEVFAKTKL